MFIFKSKYLLYLFYLFFHCSSLNIIGAGAIDYIVDHAEIDIILVHEKKLNVNAKNCKSYFTFLISFKIK
jgi:hypothetical protein